MADSAKKWGKRDFWGAGFDYDPQWLLTEDQKVLQEKLTELCRTTLRANAVKSDETYEFPRENLNAMAELGLLGLLVPKSLGGLGENNKCAAMVVETVARYGCPSTAIVYVMHLAAASALLFRHHENEFAKDLLRRVNKDKIVGSLAYSDPATGGHFWFSLSSKCWQMADGSFKALKYASWATSAGFADWYVCQVASPGFDGDYSNTSNFVFFKDEVRANTEDWIALGLHGNQSGPMIAEGNLSKDRLIGPIGDGRYSNDECVDPYFMLLTSACWNGISMGCIDIAKKHVTTKTHADVGLRVCDYPTIQAAIGSAVMDTNASRLMVFSLAGAFDQETNNNDWELLRDSKAIIARTKLLHWGWQVKYVTSKNVDDIPSQMLHVCGGSGYKTDMGLERLLRDGKAGWVMGPSNEILCDFVGKTVLMGSVDILDYWAQQPDDRIVRSEMKKMTRDQKATLLQQLQYELSLEEEAPSVSHADSFDFDNPFAKEKPKQIAKAVGKDGKEHEAGITAKQPKSLKLKSIESLTADKKIALYKFSLPKPSDHIGSVAGQYFEITIPHGGKEQTRFLSPTSAPSTYGELDVVIRHESQGVLAGFLQDLKIGDSVKLRGPCGGFEYHPSTSTHISFICGGIGITPAIQILRAMMENREDKTTATLIYQAKTADELIFKKEIDDYVSNNPERLKVTYTLQEADEDWSGSEGHISKEVLEMRLSPPDAAHKVLLCGGPHMVITCLEGLLQLHHKSEDVFIYGPFGAELLRAVYGRKTKLFQTI